MPLKADSFMSLAADDLARAAYWESRGDYSTMLVCIQSANRWAQEYTKTWVYDFIYDPAWQAKEKAARQQRIDCHSAGY